MYPFKEMAHIHSLGGKMDEITVLGESPNNNTQFIVQYGSVICTAIFNCFTNSFYADDKYGVIKEIKDNE